VAYGICILLGKADQFGKRSLAVPAIVAPAVIMAILVLCDGTLPFTKIFAASTA
jgi:hypothetical protein